MKFRQVIEMSPLWSYEDILEPNYFIVCVGKHIHGWQRLAHHRPAGKQSVWLLNVLRSEPCSVKTYPTVTSRGDTDLVGMRWL